ncbi:hypothetical protein [Phytohabitans flavus]|nr:hypothetical protein [Phytohabitans flavus]
MTTTPRIQRTGVPLLDAVAAAMLAAKEEGRAEERGDQGAIAAAQAATLRATDEVMRLWRQLDIEVSAARTAPTATRPLGRSVSQGGRATPGGETSEEGGHPPRCGWPPVA